jgi:hypothetical protein
MKWGRYLENVSWKTKKWLEGYNYKRGAKIPGARYMAAPNICGCSAWNLPHVNFLAPRILRQTGSESNWFRVLC